MDSWPHQLPICFTENSKFLLKRVDSGEKYEAFRVLNLFKHEVFIAEKYNRENNKNIGSSYV